MNKIIGIVGLAGAGKTTLADHLIRAYGFRREKMAGPLKDMLRVLGLGDAELEGPLKEVPCPLLGGATPRWAMQSLGTEWGRNQISPTLWSDAWARRASSGLVVCDDVRFLNEAALVASLGGTLIRVVRAGMVNSTIHPSESEQAGIATLHVIVNDSDIPGLLGKLDRLMQDLL